MAAFIPIHFRHDGSYIILCRVSRVNSKFEEFEYISRDIFDDTVKQSASQGEVVEPYINYGLH